MYRAKPNITNSIGAKDFVTKEAAVTYLEQVTGISMLYPRKPEKLPKSAKKLLEQFNMTPEERLRRIETGELTYDWELLGKLTRVE